MPFARPTFTQIKARIAAEIASSIPGADGLLRYSNLGVLGLVQAAAEQGLYGYLDYIARQATPFTANDEALEAWAALKGLIRKAATTAGVAPATPGQVTFAATEPATVLDGTGLVRPDGTQFISVGEAVAVGASIMVNVAAVTPGADSNTTAGAAMSLAAAVPNVSSAGTVTSAITGGAPIETDDQLRARMLAAYANPPQGGSFADYQKWSLAVSGVTRAWVRPEGLGPGTVSLYFMMDVAEAAYGGFPQGTPGLATNETRPGAKATGDMLSVADAVLAAGQPVTARVYPLAPSPNHVTFTLAGLAGASSGTKAAVSAAIVAVFLAQGSPGGVYLPNGQAGVIDLSYINSAIGGISGTAGFVITAVTCDAGSISPGPEGNIACNTGCLPVLQTVTYV